MSNISDAEPRLLGAGAGSAYFQKSSGAGSAYFQKSRERERFGSVFYIIHKKYIF
jgi:hypothetical protein